MPDIRGEIRGILVKLVFPLYHEDRSPVRDCDNCKKGIDTATDQLLALMKPEVGKGRKAIYKYPNNGYESDQKLAKKHLTLGKSYTIERIEAEDFNTKVWLKILPEIYFNSVLFELEDEATPKPIGLEEVITQSNLCCMVDWSSWAERKTRVNQLRDAISLWLTSRMEGIEEVIGRFIWHYNCEDIWYACPKSEEGAGREGETECNCGRNKRIKDLATAIREHLIGRKGI